MGAVPKKKPSKSRIKKRKAAWARNFKLPQLQVCSNCGKPKLPHKVCEYCGYYKGRKVVEIKEKEKKKEKKKEKS